MLTKTDLKSIEKVLDTKLDQKLDAKLKPIKKDIKHIYSKVDIIEKDVKKLRKDLKTTSNTLDKENLKTAKRVTLIEEHLGFPQQAII